MPDYMYLLESRLSPEQRAVMERVQELSRTQDVNVYLTGGAVRDLISGMPIRDLDFTVEGNPVKMVRELEKGGARVVWESEKIRHHEMIFAGDVDGSISAAREDYYERPGVKPEYRFSGVMEDLAPPRFRHQRHRHFAEYAIARPVARSHERPRGPGKAGSPRAFHPRIHESAHPPDAHSALCCAHGIQDGSAHPRMVRSGDRARRH